MGQRGLHQDRAGGAEQRADANRNGLISISELTGYLTRHVPGLTDGAQHPGVEMRFDGDVFVAGL